MNKHPLETLTDQYLAEKDITRRSRELYETVLKQYIRYLKKHHIIYAKTIDILNYIQWKKSKGYSSQWIYHQISAIKGLYLYLKSNQKRLDLHYEYAFDITETIKNERMTKKRISKPILSLGQAKQLILRTKENRKYIWHYRDHALIYLMITTGLRSIEVRRVKKKDLRIMNDQLILYVQGKGRTSKDEFVKITPGVKKAIDDYLTKRHDKNPYLFISHSKHTDIPYLSRTFFNKMIERVLRDSGLEDTKITAHSLRHTAATFNLLRGGTLEQTKKFMRHANISTTLLYAHHIEQLKEDDPDQLERFLLKEDDFLWR